MNPPRRVFSLTLILVLWIARPIAQGPRYQVDVQVSARSGGNAWVGYVNDRRRRSHVEYEFLLEPEYDAGELLSGWNLLLFRPEHRNENLLEPAGQWHGLQPFNFVARDLASGPDTSVLGRTRTIAARRAKATVTLRVEQAVVASGELSTLALHLELRDAG